MNWLCENIDHRCHHLFEESLHLSGQPKVISGRATPISDQRDGRCMLWPRCCLGDGGCPETVRVPLVVDRLWVGKSLGLVKCDVVRSSVSGNQTLLKVVPKV